MADTSLTIAQVKERKIALEEEILQLVSSFEEETGCRISYVSLQRHYEKEYVEPPMSMREERNRPLVNVNAEMDLDII